MFSPPAHSFFIGPTVNGGRFDHCPKLSEIYHSSYVIPPSGIRQTLTTVPHLLVPLHCTIPGALLLPLPPHPLHAHFVMNALMPNHWSHSLDSGSFT